MKQNSQRTAHTATMTTLVSGSLCASLLGSSPADSDGDRSKIAGSTIAYAGAGCPLPSCTIDFDGPCPNQGEVCGAIFAGGVGCVFEDLPFCS